MDSALLSRVVRYAVTKYPAAAQHLKGRARWIAYASGGEYKTYDYYLATLERMVRNVYNGIEGGEFIDIMANLIQGQISQAFLEAWKAEGTDATFPDYLQAASEQMILDQYDHVDQFYRDIVDARIDKTPIDPLISRCALWAARWNEAYNQGVALITENEGGNLVWELGGTEEHCATCYTLNGIVARASEWHELDVHPQGGPNEKLECGGWRCDCSLSPTDQRRSPGAYGRIEEAILAGA